MLQLDGVQTFFVHRSFQEYFCAVFLASYHGPQLRPMLDKFARRSRDVVLPMLFEMSRDRIDREWAIPRIDEIAGEESGTVNEEISSRIYRRMIERATVRAEWPKRGVVQVDTPVGSFGDDFHTCESIFQFYCANQPFGPEGLMGMFVTRGLIQPVQRMLTNYGKEPEFSTKHLEEDLQVTGNFEKRVGRKLAIWTVEIQMTPQIAAKVGLTELIGEFVQTLRAVKTDIEKRIGSQDSMVEMLCREATLSVKPRAPRRRTQNARSARTAKPL